jgi:hypothetical protein
MKKLVLTLFLTHLLCFSQNEEDLIYKSASDWLELQCESEINK